MADNELLSEEEILALVEMDESGEGEAYNVDAQAQEYDIASEDSTLTSHLGSLEVINERFARIFRISLKGLLRYQPKIEPMRVDVERFSTYMESLSTPISLNVVKIPPLRGSMLIIIDPQLIFNSLDSFFGGAGSHTEISGIRDFTPTEYRIIQMILQHVFHDMKTAWAPMYAVNFEFINSEVNPQFTTIVDENDLVIINKFNIEMAQGINGSVQIVYPYAAMKPIRELLRNQVIGDSDMDDERIWNNYLKVAISDVLVDIKSELASPVISLFELRNLKVGDVIPIKMPETVTVGSAGIPLFNGIYGSSNGNAAVKIIDEVKQDDYAVDLWD
jgi:flagellar motor switch protein FliM